MDFESLKYYESQHLAKKIDVPDQHSYNVNQMQLYKGSLCPVSIQLVASLLCWIHNLCTGIGRTSPVYLLVTCCPIW